jgi:hypothetical protein
VKNDFEIRGDVTAIFINSPKYGTKEVIISTNKLKRAQEFAGSWRANWNQKAKAFYVQGHMPLGHCKYKGVQLHRWITDAPKGMQVDHINHDTLKNTDDNLRICTHSENQQNRKGATSNNKSSGIRGVSWNISDKRWQVRIRFNNKRVHLGNFTQIEEAEQAVKEARAKYMPFSKDA